MGDADRLIPLAQVEASVELLRQAGANVTYQLYRGLGHSVIHHETDILRTMVTALAQSEE
jgi:predicted esterase